MTQTDMADCWFLVCAGQTICKRGASSSYSEMQVMLSNKKTVQHKQKGVRDG